MFNEEENHKFKNQLREVKENKTKNFLKYVSGGEKIMNYYFHSSNVLGILKQSGFVSAFRFCGLFFLFFNGLGVKQRSADPIQDLS